MNPAPEESSVLQILRISLHVMFAFLLAVGFISALQDDAAPGRLTVGSLALALTYMAGTIVENRFARGKFGGVRGANLVRSRPALARTWLAIVVMLWLVLLYHHSSFTWMMFPLVFLCMHLLPVIPALGAVALLTGISIGLPAIQTQHESAHELSAGAIIGPSLGALLAIIISLAYRQLHRDSLAHQRTAEKLRATQAELAQKEHESGRLEERERLAREIHDTLAQGLSSIVLISRAAAAKPTAPEVGEQLSVINRVAADNLAEARRFIRDLSSPSLTTSLVPALERLCAETQRMVSARGDSLSCTVHLDGDQSPLSAAELPEPIQEALIRITQGALANVAAHAHAQHAVVTLGLWEHATTLDIFDDGRGFIPTLAAEAHPTHPADGSGYGLVSLRARAVEIGAELAVESTPGEGTVVTLSLPHSSLTQGRS